MKNKTTFGKRAVVQKELGTFSVKAPGGKVYTGLDEKSAYALQDAIFNGKKIKASSSSESYSEGFLFKATRALQRLLVKRKVVYDFSDYFFELTLLIKEESEAAVYLVVNSVDKKVQLTNYEETKVYMECGSLKELGAFLDDMLHEYRSRYIKGRILTRG